MRTHLIKLKGPWTVRRATPTVGGDPADPRVVHLPVEWRTLFGDVAGTAVFQRRFNCPTGLTPGHRVRIRFRDTRGLAGVQINQQLLPIETAGDGIQSVDVRDWLQPHNILSVDIRFDPREHPGLPGGLWLPVVIQIEEPGGTER